MIKFEAKEKNGFLVLRGIDTVFDIDEKVAIPLKNISLVSFGFFVWDDDTNEDVIRRLENVGVIIGEPQVEKMRDKRVIFLEVKGLISRVEVVPGCIRASHDSNAKATTYYWYGEANEVLSNYFFGD